MENGNQCFCGTVLPAAAIKRPGECTTVCPGDHSEMCGGSWRINIFDVPGKFTVLLYIIKLQDFNTFTNFVLYRVQLQYLQKLRFSFVC